MLRRTAGLAAALLALAPALSACGTSVAGGSGPTVVVGAYPMQYAVESSVGDQVEVVSVAQPGQEPHDLELGVRQVAEVLEADLVVLESGFQPALDTLLEQNPGIPTVDARTMRTTLAPEVRPDDPHFWLDPSLMADLGDNVVRALSRIDPEHRDDYRGDVGGLRSDMQRLDLAYGDRLARCEREVVVVSHEAYDYLDRYGLEFLPVVGRTPEAEPSVGDLARIEAEIERLGVTTVFSEPLGGDGPVAALAEDTGTRLAVLDPLESQPVQGDYLSVMRDNLRALEHANGCGAP